ncbi:hypothetical protein QFZ94_008393 [Paraburkholderia sp. JPY465]
MRYHTKKFEDDSKASAAQEFVRNEAQRQKETAQVGRLLLLYVDDALDDTLPFGSVRRQAFSIMPKAALQQTGQRLTRKPVSQMELRWQAPVQIGSVVEIIFRDLDTLSIEQDGVPNRGRGGIAEPERAEVELRLANAMHQLDA